MNYRMNLKKSTFQKIEVQDMLDILITKIIDSLILEIIIHVFKMDVFKTAMGKTTSKMIQTRRLLDPYISKKEKIINQIS